MSSRHLAGALLLIGSSALAGGLDRDGLFTEAPATPDSGTVRVSASAASSEGADGTAQAQLSGTVMWAPIEHLAADVGAYFQGSGSQSGPSVRARYQLLSQAEQGVDLAGGLRYKSLGFDPNDGEVELLVAAGRRVGRFDVMLNAVFGVELGAGGKDLEVKAFGGYRLTDAFRVGLDSRAQFEVGDAEAVARPAAGSDLDVTAGPAVSWMIGRSLQLQALAGLAKPKGAPSAGGIAQMFLSFDF